MTVGQRPDICDGAAIHVRRLQNIQKFSLARLAQAGFQFRRMVKIIFQSGLAPRGDENELCDTCGARLIDGILYQGPVNQRHDFLGHRFGRRQEPRAESGNRKDSFRYFCAHVGPR